MKNSIQLQLQKQATEHKQAADLLDKAADIIQFQIYILDKISVEVTMMAPLGSGLAQCLDATKDFPWLRFNHNDRLLSEGKITEEESDS